MVMASIVISQAGRPQGLPGVSRADLSVGVEVVLTNHDNRGVESWAWKLRAVPPGSQASLRGDENPVATFAPDVPGSYVVELIVGAKYGGAVSDRRIGAVRTPLLGLRKPAAIEDREFDPTHRQWLAVAEAFDLIDAASERDLRKDGSNSPETDISWGGHGITNLGAVELEGALRFGRTRDPEAVPEKGFLYLKDIGRSTDLVYCAPDGSVIRLTKDGRLNVPASFDDRIKVGEQDEAPGYLGEKLEVVGGLSKSVVDGAVRIEPVFGSEPGTICAGDDPRLSRSEPEVAKPCGVVEPAPLVVPLSDGSSTLDAWVSKTSGTRHGTIVLGCDLAGSSDSPVVVGLHGRPIPLGEGFLRWGQGSSRMEIVAYGDSPGTVCRGDDPRLSDQRPPHGDAGGQLAGVFPTPCVVGVTEADGEQLMIGKIPNRCILARLDDKVVGIDLSGRRTVAMVLNEKVCSEHHETIGAFMLDGTQDASPVVFQIICRVTRDGLVGAVALHNATDGKPVCEMGVVETSFACRKSAAFRPLPGKRLYEVRAKVSGIGQPLDALVCMWAGLLMG